MGCPGTCEAEDIPRNGRVHEGFGIGTLVSADAENVLLSDGDLWSLWIRE